MCQDEHFELITESYVLVWQAVSTAGWELTAWEDAIDLRPRTEGDGLVPDAFFCVQRPDGIKASFFLELERAAKSDQSMRRKLEKHVRFFRSGRYEEVFGLRSLRVLFVMVSSQKPRVSPAERIGRLAEQIGATFVCSATLSSLRAGSATDLLFGDKWWRPGAGDGYRLFEWQRE